MMVGVVVTRVMSSPENFPNLFSDSVENNTDIQKVTVAASVTVLSGIIQVSLI